MPTQIVDLDELVPDDVEFHYRGQKLVLPGDLSVETTFKLQKVLLALETAEKSVTDAAEKGGTAQQKAIAEQERLTLEVEQLLLGLFRQRDSELEQLPFGARGLQHVLSLVLIKLGFGGVVGEDDAVPPPNRAARRKSARSRTSRSS